MRIGTWAEHLRKGTCVRGDLGGKRDSSVKVGRALFAAFQRSPIIDEIRQPVYPASALEQERCTGSTTRRRTVKLNLQWRNFLHPDDAADTDVNLMNTFPAGMVEYHALEAGTSPDRRPHWREVGGALWAQWVDIIVAKLVANCSLQEPWFLW